MKQDRRQFLQIVGATSLGSLAGCLGGDGDDENATGTPSSTSPGTQTSETPTGDDGGGNNEDNGDGTGDGDGGSGSVPTVISMNAGGEDIWDAADQGLFYYTTVTGDFEATVHVTALENTNPHAKAGLMARASLDADAKNIMARKRAGFGISGQWRPEAGAQTTSTTSEGGSELSRVEGGILEGDWVRLQRAGDTVRIYGSQDGENWSLIVALPSSVVELPDELYVGLAATSHSAGTATTAKFRDLSGIDPTETATLGEPLVSGSVDEAQTAIVNPAEPANAEPTSVTLQAAVENLGGADPLTLTFEYRDAMSEEWSDAGTTEVSSTGTAGLDVSGLQPRTYYYFRVTADTGENTSTTVGYLFSTPSGSQGATESGPESVSAFDPNDGFVEMGAWVTDDTPVVRVTEPTRDELERALSIPGPRIVVFETSGTIDLGAQDLNVRNDNVWIAGQTAPSPGITLVRGGLWLYGNNSIVQHIRVRPGTAAQETGWDADSIVTADGSENQIVDHCTTTWSIDENLSVGYDTNNTTFTNNLVAEPLHDATHPKGPHGYNSLIGNNANHVTLAGNIWGLVTDRNPRVKTGVRAVIANNYNNYFQDGVWLDPDTQTSIVGNEYEFPQSDEANIFGQGESYVDGNRLDRGDEVSMVGPEVQTLSSEPLWPDGLETIPVEDVQSHNLENAGARPADRTEHDERIVSMLRNGEGHVIDNQSEVGGYPVLEANTAELDIPTQNLKAWLREQAIEVEQR